LREHLGREGRITKEALLKIIDLANEFLSF